MPDDTFSSDANEASGEMPSGGAGALRRIAVAAREPKDADALWSAIEKRFRQKERVAVLRSVPAEADVGVYVLAAEDFADSRAARAKTNEIANDPAPRKFLIEPYTLSSKQSRERLASLLSAFARHSGVAKLDADSLANHAKAIARALKSEVPNAAKTPKPVREPKPEKPPVSEAQKAARKEAKRLARDAAKAKRRTAKPPKPAQKAGAAAGKKKKAKVAGKGAKSPKKETAKAKQGAPTKEARKKAKPERARPEAKIDAITKASKKDAKRRAKETAQKRKRPQPAPQDLAAKAERKAQKAKAKQSRRVRPTPTPEDLAAKQTRKAEKAKAKEAKRRRPEPTAEELAAKEARKAEKAKAKEAKKKPEPTAEELAAKEARKAEKAKAKEAKKKPEPTAEELAAKEARKAEKAKAKEAKKKPEPTAEELAAKEARKAEKAKAKEAKKKPEPTAEELAAKEARKAEKAKAKEAKKKPEPTAEELAAKEARKAEKAKAKEAKKKPEPTAEELAAKEARKAEKAKAKEAKKKPEPTAEELAAKEARKAEKAKAKEAKKKPEPTAEELAAKEARKAEKAKAKEAKKKPEPTVEELAAKEARKAEKAKAKEAKKKPEPTAEELAAKEARKAEKAKAKEAKKKPEPTAEELAAKEARKAEKAKAKEAKKKPEPTAEELAAKEARKAEKAKAKEAKKKPEPTAEELAAKEARKAEKAKAKGTKKDKPESTPEEIAAKAQKKEAKRQAKEGSKSERRAKNKDSEEDPAEREAQKAARAASRAERKARGEEGDEEQRPLRLLFWGMESTSPLGSAIQDAFRAAGTEIETSTGRSDVAIHAFDGLEADGISRSAAAVKQDKARLRIFLERPTDAGGDANRAIVRLAYACNASLLNLSAKLRRFGLENALSGGEPSELGRTLIAQSVVGLAAAKLSGNSLVPPQPLPAPDFALARALAPSVALPELRWSKPSTPKSIWVHISKEDVEALADSKVMLPGEDAAPLALPLDWSREFEDGRTAHHVKGLDFLAGPLAYWYAKANGQSSQIVGEIDAALKQRGMTPNVVLARSAQIIADFIARQPRATAPDAWEEGPLSRRARVFLMYVLCCKTALKKKIKFNEAACAMVHGALLDTLEALRGDDFYEAGSAEGLQLDCLLIGIALALRGSAYGASLLTESLDRLKRLQIEPGLSADGVWLGDSYATHTSVLSTLTTLIGDFAPTDAALVEPFAATAKRMTVFAEAMLKSNGHPLAIDGSRQRSYAEKLSGLRRTIARSAGKQAGAKGPLRARITDTYVFRDAQYFISHSAQTVTPADSLAVLHAASPAVARQDPGGVTIVFAQGESNLLVRAEPAEKVRARQDPTPLYDPALRNSYRVNGEGNAPPAEASAKAARIAKSWRGAGWAAARSLEDIYANAVIGRTAIHLKAMHALVVVDELATEDGAEAEFEQFWRIAPEFAPSAAVPLGFASADKGGVQVAMSGEAVTDSETGEAGTCLRRRLRLSRGTVATIFQWTDGSAPLSIAVERETQDGWAIQASGKGFSLRASLAGSDLRCGIDGA